MIELWKPIKDYETLYLISNFGRVKSLDKIVPCRNGYRTVKEKILVPSRSGNIRSDGSYYLKVMLTKNNKSTNKYIHRLVAETFLENPNNYLEINHIDENKQNNKYDNLEWCNRKQNNNHSQITQKLNDNKKLKVIQLSLNDEIIKIWDGVREASRGLGMKTHKHIISCCNGKANTCYGYKWEYGE